MSSVSRLAIAGLAFALVPCCPPSSLIGALLGVIAMRRWRMRGGSIAERRVAIAAVLIGVASTIVWSGLLPATAAGMLKGMSPDISRETSTIVEAVRAGRDADVRRAWSPDPATYPTDEQLAACRAAFGDLGAFRGFDVSSLSQGGPTMEPRLEAIGQMRFESDTLLGAVRVRVLRITGSGRVRVERLVIETPDGEIVLGLDSHAEAGSSIPSAP